MTRDTGLRQRGGRIILRSSSSPPATATATATATASSAASMVLIVLFLVSLLLTTPPNVNASPVTPRGGGYEEEDRDAGAYFHAMVEAEREGDRGGDYYFDDDYPAAEEEEDDGDGYDDLVPPMRPSWFGDHGSGDGKDDEDEGGGRPPLPLPFGGGGAGGGGKDDHGFGGGYGGRPPLVDSFDYSSICPARRPPIGGYDDYDTNGGGGGGGGKHPVGTPSESSVIVSRLPGLMVDFAFNPNTGDVAGVDPIADRAYLFRRADLEGVGVATSSGSSSTTIREVNFTAVDVGRTPVDIVYKRYEDEDYYVVVCRHDPHLYVIDANDFTLVKKVALSSRSGTTMMMGGAAAVASSIDPDDPFVYYGRRGPRRYHYGGPRPPRGGPPPRGGHHGSSGPATLSAFDVRTMTDRGVVKILEEEEEEREEWEWNEWDREEEEWDWDWDWNRKDKEEGWDFERPDGPRPRPGGGGGRGGGRSPFELAVSSDGNVVYTRSSPHGPTIAHIRHRGGPIEEETSDLNYTVSKDIPRFVEGGVNDNRRRSEYYKERDFRDRAIAFVHPGPFGEVVCLGPSIYSSDLKSELVELDFVPGCFFRNRSLIVGYVDSNAEHPYGSGRRVDRPDVLMAASYNTYDPLGRPLALTMPHQRADKSDDLDDAYLEYGAYDKQERYDLRVSMCVDGLEDGKRLRLRRRLFADDDRGTVVVAHGDDVILIPVDELHVPHEPFLRLEFDQESGGHLVAGGLLEVVPLRATDLTVDVFFEQGKLPRGASYDGERGYLSWAPSIEQIGTHLIEANLRHVPGGGGRVVERVVPLTINVSLPFIELPFVDGGGCPLIDERGRFVVVWSNDQDNGDNNDREHYYGGWDGDYHYYPHKQDYYREPEDEDPHESMIAIVPTGTGSGSESIPSTMTKGGLPRIDKVMLSDDLVIVVHRREGGHRGSGTTTVSFYDAETFELVKTVAFRRGGRGMEFEMCSGHELLVTSSGYDHNRRPRPPHYYYEEEWAEEIYHAMGGNSDGNGYPHELYDLRDFSVRRFRAGDVVDCDARFRDEPMVDGVVRRGVLHNWGDGGGQPLLVLDSSRFPTVAVNWTGTVSSVEGGLYGPPRRRSWLPGPNVPCSSYAGDDSSSRYETAWMDGGRMCVQLETRTTEHSSADEGGGGGTTLFEVLLRVFSIDGNMIANPTVIRGTCTKNEETSWHSYGRRGDGLCHSRGRGGRRPKLLVTGADVYVVLGREITVWSEVDNSKLTALPGNAVTIEPRSLPSTTVKTRYFRLVPRQSMFLIDPTDRQVSLRHEATGGTPPYEYFVESPDLLLANNHSTNRRGEIVVNSDEGTGTTVIDGVRLREVGVDTLVEYHKTHGRARLRALSLKTVEPWTDTFGTKPPEGVVPVGLPLRVRAVDAGGLTAEMVYYVYTHVPYSDVVEAIEGDDAATSWSRSSTWNHQTVTGGWGLSSILLVAVFVLAAVVIACLSILVVRLNRRIAVLSSVGQDETQLEPLQEVTATTPPPSPEVNKAILIDDASSSTDCASAREEN